MQIIKGVLGALVVSPIWMYLLYQMLEKVEATELMWFLYWIYVPAAFVVAAITLATNEKK